MKKRQSKNKYNVEVPQLPCELYKASPSKRQTPMVLSGLMVIGAICSFIFIEDRGWAVQQGIMLLVFSPFVLLDIVLTKGNDTLSVFLTPETISAELTNEKIENDQLGNYELLISQKMNDDDYKYEIYIRKKSIYARDILLAENIRDPLNLREWIFGLQIQLKNPLNVEFSGEQVERDFKTGVYKSKEKRSG